jgi:hypothetical protein
MDRRGAALDLARTVRDWRMTGRVAEADEGISDLDELVGYRELDGWYWPRDIAEAAGLARVGFGSGPVRMSR